MCRTLILLSLLVLSLSFASAATLTGKVVGEDGQPIKGANLFLRRSDDETTQSLVSDAVGSFSIEVDTEVHVIGNIVACAPGYALTGSTLTAHDNVITLSTGSTLSGTVADTQGKPLAGISIRLLGVQHNNDYAGVPETWRDRFTVTTGADGTWTLPGIPPEGTISIALADDRYVHEQREITLVKGEPADPVAFTVRPGAVLTGRVLTPKGTPAVDAMVTVADGHIMINSETAADGSYRFAGLASGTYTIDAYSKEQAWIAEQLKDIALVEGKVTTVADLHARTGAVLDGMLQNVETGAPIAGRALIELVHDNTGNSEAPQYRIITADKQGHFRIRTLPGRMTLHFEMLPTGYLQPKDAEALTVDLREGNTTTIVLKLHKGLSVTGTVTDEAGKPVAGAQFTIRVKSDNGNDVNANDMQLLFTTDQHGHFDVSGLPAGKGSINLYHDGRQICAWEQSAPQPIDVPAKGPIAVTVTRAALHTLIGRVVDTRQQPLSGVKVTFSMPPAQGMGAKVLTAITADDGRYHLDIPAAKSIVSLLSLEKKGYRQLLASTLTSTGSDMLDDAVMAACTATVHGKVCEAGGQPVKGAILVSAEGGLAARAVSDESGAFTLTAQPEGELHLIAATPTGGGLLTCRANDTNVTLTCTPAQVAKPADISLARQLLDADSKLLKEQRWFNRAETLHDIADRDFALANKLAQSDEEPIPDGLRAYLLGKQAELDPAGIPEVLAQLNLLQDADCKLYAAVEMGIAVANTIPDLAEQLYQIAKPIYDHSPHGHRDNGAQYIEGLGTFPDISLRTIALAALLHKTADVDAMLAALSAQAKQDPGECYLIIQPLFAAAGRVSPEFVLQVYQRFDVPTPYKIGYLGEALASMAQHDPAAAQRLLKMIDARQSDGYPSADPAPVIIAMGKHDPASALALAKATPRWQQPALLLTAAAFQPKAAAGTLMQEVFSEIRNRTIDNIALANAADLELAKAFYTQNKQTLEAETYNFTDLAVINNDSQAEVRVHYAYLISSIDPIEARLILETEYAAALARVQHGEQAFVLQRLPQAMCALDVARAQAMVDNLNGFHLDRQFFGQRFMHYILMPREERVASAYF